MQDPAFKRSLVLWLEGWMGRGDLAGAARLELVLGVVQLRPEDAMFEAMLRGWRAQQTARGLREDTIGARERLMRRFGEFTGDYPWAWTAGRVDEWSLHLTAEQHLAPSTIRSYQCSLRQFSEFLIDGRYAWVPECEGAFGPGVHPVPIVHEWNTIAHLNDYEGDPEARPFTRQELQRFLDYADDQVERAARAKRKGALAAYRDATLFKVMYGWGLRRTETSKLDVVDWGPQSGGAGVRPLRDAQRPLRQGQARAATAAPQRRLGNGLGGGGSRRLCRERAAPVRLRRPSGVVGDRAGRPGQACGDQRPVRRPPAGAGPAGCSGPALDPALLRQPSHRGRGRPP